MLRPTFRMVLIAVAVLGGRAALAETGSAFDPPLPAAIEFNRDIRPILSDNCFYCHGPDKNQRKADLRLDTREGLLADLGGYRAAEPGKPQESAIIERIAAADPGDLMPPPDSGKALTPRQIALIRKWIEQGVDFEGHWLYIPPSRPPVPAVEHTGFVRNDIDRFILARLRSEGLDPSPEADRATLIRRVSFDLTGLPPDPARAQQLLTDDSPRWYERYVDSLLASPHYGERMAIYWLDLVRFADTVGYHGDRPMNIYPYRDYVIRSFNGNKPFDRFTVEQLAGDLLPGATLEQKIASGYNRLNMMSEEGGIQDKEYLAKYAADRVRNLSGTWMGSTIGCAECHDHKFDPFTAKDFYRMQAFFADIKEVGYYGGKNENGNWGEYILVPTPEQQAQIDRLESELGELRTRLDQTTDELRHAQARWEATALSQKTEWSPVTLVETRSAHGATLTQQPDGSILVGGTNPATDDYILTFTVELAEVRAIRLEALPDPSLAKGGAGRADNGQFILSEVELQVDGQPARLASASATFEQTGFMVTNAIDGEPTTGWAVFSQFTQPQTAVFETADDLEVQGGRKLTVTLRMAQGHKTTLGKFRLSVTGSERPNTADGLPETVAKALAVEPSARTQEQTKAIGDYFRSFTPLLRETRNRIAALEREKKRLSTSAPTTLVTVATEPRVIRVLPRGNWMDDSGEVVEPGVPHFLPQIEREGRATRLDLAHWLTRRDNPFTARVFVNRLWKLAFGAGLSRNVTDLGSQGEWPTHPELLDWLAMEFVDSGWDVKHVLRLIVTSGTYRQTSLMRPDLKDLDPFNRLYARQSRFRLDAEMIRDNALAVSGLLVRDLYGPSAKPYQPPGYYAYLNFPVREYEPDKGDGLYRRGVYTWWQRQYLHPALLAFDAPSREECTAERPRSNTPLQALVLLNDPSYVEAARVFAERIIREGGRTSEDRAAWAVRRALVREATPRELGVLTALYRGHLDQYRRDPSGAELLLGVGEHPAASDLDRAELAAWTSAARAVLNLNETITRD